MRTTRSLPVLIVVATALLAPVVARADRASGLGVATAAADCAVGLAFAVAAVSGRAPWRARTLIAGVGLAWLLGGFSPLAGLHRGLLAHALLAFPSGRLGSTHRRLTVLAVYVATLATSSVTLSAAGFALTALVAWSPLSGQGGRGRAIRTRARLYPVLGALLMVAVLAAEGWLDAAGVTVRADTFVAIYETALVVVAVGFPFAARGQRWASADVSELVVELNPQGGLPAFANAMARLVEDPSLRVLEWNRSQGAFVDEQGEPLDPSSGAAQILPVAEDGEPLAVVIHRAGSLSEPGMAQAATEAVRLAVHHTRLRRQEQTQIAELTASRGRLAASADAQRTRIEHRLRASVAEPAADLATRLAKLDSGVPAVDQLTRTAADELASVAAELAALTRGMRPQVLESGGLSFAIAELANRSALDVRVDNRLRGALAPQVETAAYFVCAEALVNVAKHSGASVVEVILDASEAQVRLSIRDDGVGGADLSRGTGLAGLADRLAALGGRFEVASPAGVGTTLTAELPISTDPKERV